MHITSFGKQLFLFMFAAIAVCSIIALIFQLINNGRKSGFCKTIVALAAVTGSFLSHHWSDIGVFTREEWMHKTAVATIIVEAFVIILLSLSISDEIYKRIHKK